MFFCVAPADIWDKDITLMLTFPIRTPTSVLQVISPMFLIYSNLAVNRKRLKKEPESHKTVKNPEELIKRIIKRLQENLVLL